MISSSKISIGLPVHNGANSLEQAIQSLLGQSFENFELIISDNASTDDTETLCRKFAATDTRIRYIRQTFNIGATKNFKYVLEQSKNNFFMWAAHDDLWDIEFIEKNLLNLENNPQAIASMSNVLLNGCIHNVGFSGVKPLIGNSNERLLSFLEAPGLNSRFYSIFRREALNGINLDEEYIAKDWAIIVDLIYKGEMLTLMDYRGFNKSLCGAGSSISHFKTSRMNWIEWFLPYAAFSTHVLRKNTTFAVVPPLIILNLKANVRRIKGFCLKIRSY